MHQIKFILQLESHHGLNQQQVPLKDEKITSRSSGIDQASFYQNFRYKPFGLPITGFISLSIALSAELLFILTVLDRHIAHLNNLLPKSVRES